MEGLSERQYAARVGLSRGTIQKAKATGRLVLHADGGIDAVASDALRAEATDPSKTRKAPQSKLKPAPEAAVSAVGETLREQGMTAPSIGSGTTFLQAKTANEVLKAQERRIRLQKLKGELIDRARALSLVFRLARQERNQGLPAHPRPGCGSALCHEGRRTRRVRALTSADPARVIAIARSWLGTPYHDQASFLCVGCDCPGLARGVWREVVGPEPFPTLPIAVTGARPDHAKFWQRAHGA